MSACKQTSTCRMQQVLVRLPLYPSLFLIYLNSEKLTVTISKTADTVGGQHNDGHGKLYTALFGCTCLDTSWLLVLDHQSSHPLCSLSGSCSCSLSRPTSTSSPPCLRPPLSPICPLVLLFVSSFFLISSSYSFCSFSDLSTSLFSRISQIAQR